MSEIIDRVIRSFGQRRLRRLLLISVLSSLFGLYATLTTSLPLSQVVLVVGGVFSVFFLVLYLRGLSLTQSTNSAD